MKDWRTETNQTVNLKETLELGTCKTVTILMYNDRFFVDSNYAVRLKNQVNSLEKELSELKK